MRKDELQEIKLRTVKLDSQEVSKNNLDIIELRLNRLFSQTHEVVNGSRRKLTKSRKIAKGNILIDRYVIDINLDKDAINQLKYLNL